MTKREAWLWLEEEVSARTMQFFGLCELLDQLFSQNLISERTNCAMKRQIQALPSYTGSDYKWATTEAGAEQRAAFCRAQAAKCEGVTT